MSGRTSKVHTVVPLEQVSTVTGESSRTVGISQLNVTIVFVDGSQLQLEIPRVELTKDHALVDTLATRRPGTPNRSHGPELTVPTARMRRLPAPVRCRAIRIRGDLPRGRTQQIATAASARGRLSGDRRMARSSCGPVNLRVAPRLWHG